MMSQFEVERFRFLKRITPLLTTCVCGLPQKKALLALKKQSSTSQTNQGGLKRSKCAALNSGYSSFLKDHCPFYGCEGSLLCVLCA